MAMCCSIKMNGQQPSLMHSIIGFVAFKHPPKSLVSLSVLIPKIYPYTLSHSHLVAHALSLAVTVTLLTSYHITKRIWFHQLGAICLQVAHFYTVKTGAWCPIMLTGPTIPLVVAASELNYLAEGVVSQADHILPKQDCTHTSFFQLFCSTSQDFGVLQVSWHHLHWNILFLVSLFLAPSPLSSVYNDSFCCEFLPGVYITLQVFQFVSFLFLVFFLGLLKYSSFIKQMQFLLLCEKSGAILL